MTLMLQARALMPLQSSNQTSPRTYDSHCRDRLCGVYHTARIQRRNRTIGSLKKRHGHGGARGLSSSRCLDKVMGRAKSRNAEMGLHHPHCYRMKSGSGVGGMHGALNEEAVAHTVFDGGMIGTALGTHGQASPLQVFSH